MDNIARGHPFLSIYTAHALPIVSKPNSTPPHPPAKVLADGTVLPVGGAKVIVYNHDRSKVLLSQVACTIQFHCIPTPNVNTVP